MVNRFIVVYIHIVHFSINYIELFLLYSKIKPLFNYFKLIINFEKFKGILS